jgi:hypothetical protein
MHAKFADGVAQFVRTLPKLMQASCSGNIM